MKVYLRRKQTVQQDLSKMKVEWVSSKSTEIQAATDRQAAKAFYEILKRDYDPKQREYSPNGSTLETDEGGILNR